MPRYALKIEYHGGGFSGWQRQKAHPSVQQAVEEALRRLEPDAPAIAAAGRTDAGVHALGQVAHCDMARAWDPFRLSEALNHHLKPEHVAVVDAARVADDWHARFSATERQYLYRMICRRAPLTHDRGLAWRVPQAMDVAAMRDGAAALVGQHDFTTFRASECQAKSPVKTVDAIEVTAAEAEVRIAVRARSFLHNQVRSFVGTLERVGAGAWAPDAVKAALDARDRAACGPVAPPDGLYLTRVGYPADPFA
ncbi:tRNA pseudouridine(38-40) synthase TruA [Psychromarinibacter sp. C21-152]|uniref:tRNA pseudouridine synthase A n=1 Tax=Psychromarinibacter sediminicola TaxID=3033385 RepID=A0AAE3NR76_9RHOB|nr:tRNA pseudouridine(38-40) synthase TruA [Psychromarinibacter sediminicola]MDF0600566.1 tRNA pseudouridine(38-40) synthase TruA [Psychromarinibacter sediminicola]